MAFTRGLLITFRVPGTVLCATSMGFGALARDLQFDLQQALLITAAFYALPAQVIFVDQLARGATVISAMFAVMLTAVRLLPMTVALMPYLRDCKTPDWVSYLIVHFVAVTAWIEGSRVLPGMPIALRIPHYAGIGLGMLVATLSGTTLGFTLSGSVPPILSATLLFMTPIYFLLSMFDAARNASDHVAIALGAVLGPTVYLLAPGIDLLATGLVGGTVAFFMHRIMK
ncbi:MAG: AzlC family ABC transporter permease [Hyphomicrobiaceae bacterium]